MEDWLRPYKAVNSSVFFFLCREQWKWIWDIGLVQIRHGGKWIFFIKFLHRGGGDVGLRWRTSSDYTHVRLMSALQRASSVICYGAGIPLVTHRGIFFDSPVVCTACIRFISSLRTVHMLSVCLTSSPRPNDYFIAFFVFTARITILFQQHSCKFWFPECNKG